MELFDRIVNPYLLVRRVNICANHVTTEAHMQEQPQPFDLFTVSRFHPSMARIKRTAQFAFFDALTGFGASIHEAGRETEEKKELSEDEIEMRNARLAVIEQHIKEQPNIAVTYFLPDEKKTGGRYVTVSGNVKMLDGIERVIIMTDRTKIPIEDVRYIGGGFVPHI